LVPQHSHQGLRERGIQGGGRKKGEELRKRVVPLRKVLWGSNFVFKKRGRQGTFFPDRPREAEKLQTVREGNILERVFRGYQCQDRLSATGGRTRLLRGPHPKRGRTIETRKIRVGIKTKGPQLELNPSRSGKKKCDDPFQSQQVSIRANHRESEEGGGAA